MMNRASVLMWGRFRLPRKNSRIAEIHASIRYGTVVTCAPQLCEQHSIEKRGDLNLSDRHVEACRDRRT